ncbi:hypothetical protein AVEN_85410-1 [Araneus ventricosus]|uniref:Uncharacterized protein n=1 Tax=Araneus ventricosus TaxID=182803 RepID=A0A4Y2FL57_ARAVE|nr:hypothetical protein AVEN_85410-1 [Araneus ventricosus]
MAVRTPVSVLQLLQQPSFRFPRELPEVTSFVVTVTLPRKCTSSTRMRNSPTQYAGCRFLSWHNNGGVAWLTGLGDGTYLLMERFVHVPLVMEAFFTQVTVPYCYLRHSSFNVRGRYDR